MVWDEAFFYVHSNFMCSLGSALQVSIPSSRLPCCIDQGRRGPTTPNQQQMLDTTMPLTAPPT